MIQQEEFKDQITLFQLVKILWKQKWQLLTGITAVTVLAAILTLILPKTYLSRSVLAVSDLEKIRIEEKSPSSYTGMAIPVFQNYMSTFQSKQIFITYLKKYHHREKWSERNFNIGDRIEPILAYPEKNPAWGAKNNFVVSLTIDETAATPEKAMEKNTILGKYIRTTLLNLWLNDQVFSWKTHVSNTILKNEMDLEKFQDYINELKEKETFLTGLIAQTPGILIRQEPVNVNKRTEKYLPPQQQLLAIRIEIKDTEISIAHCKKRLEINNLLLDFHVKLTSFFDADKRFLANETLLADLVQAQQEFFKEKTGPAVSAAIYKAHVKFTYYANFSSSLYEFVSAPSLPVQPVRPRRLKIIVLSCLAACFFFIFLAFAREWWKRNETR